jgi:hypothetical protein
VAAHRYHQAHGDDRQAADDKRQPARGVGKQHQSGDGEKESGWHHKQSGVLHALLFLLRFAQGFGSATAEAIESPRLKRESRAVEC